MEISCPGAHFMSSRVTGRYGARGGVSDGSTALGEVGWRPRGRRRAAVVGGAALEGELGHIAYRGPEQLRAKAAEQCDKSRELNQTN